MSRWVRRTALLIVLGIAGVGMLPAQAGGPTSVLLSTPELGKVVATGYQDKAYGELQRLLDAKSREAPGDERNAVGLSVRATWLIHDEQPYRRDVIYPDAPGGPWIATVQDVNGTAGLSGEPVWHRAADPVQLIKLLVSLDLLHGKANGRLATQPPATNPPATSAPSTLPEDDTPVTALKIEEKPLLGWRWSIPGFLVGAIAAYLALRYLPRRNWQLIDEE